MVDTRVLSTDDLCVLLGVTKANQKLDIIVLFIIVITAAVIGWILGSMIESFSIPIMIIASEILFLGIYGIWGFRIVPAQQVWIVEEFGKYKKSLNAGWNFLCLPGIIDTIAKKSISLKTQKLDVMNKRPIEVNFKCGSSALVHFNAWYQIKNPILWHYQTKKSEYWLYSQISNFLLMIFENRTLDKTLGQQRNIKELLRQAEDWFVRDKDGRIYFINNNHVEASCVKEDHRISFKQYLYEEIGVDLIDLLIEDVDIPKNIQKVRRSILKTSTNRRARSEQASGYAEAIAAIKVFAAENSVTINDAQAIEIYNQNKDRESFQGSGANVTIVSSDIRNAIKSMFPEKLNGQ